MPVSPSTWIGFATVSILFSLVPGPAFIVVLSTSLRGGTRAGLYANAGVVVGDAIYFTLAALGLGSVLAASYLAFRFVKWLGVAYLGYIGFRTLLYPESDLVPYIRPSSTGHRVFTAALLIQMANPKLLLFLAALVPQFIDTRRSVAPQLFVLGATFMFSDAIVFLIVTKFANEARKLFTKPWAARATSRVTGIAMLGAAVRIGSEH